MTRDQPNAGLLLSIINAQTQSTIVFANLLARAGIASMDEITRLLEEANGAGPDGGNFIAEGVIDALRADAIQRGTLHE